MGLPPGDQRRGPAVRHRFRPDQRIRSPKHFERAFRTGSRARGAILLVVLVENGLERTRLGLSVGRAVWRRAVKRNRVRRVFREAFRLAQHELPEGVDVVLVPAEKRLVPELEPTRRELVALARKARRRLEDKRERERAAAEERAEADARRLAARAR